MQDVREASQYFCHSFSFLSQLLGFMSWRMVEAPGKAGFGQDARSDFAHVSEGRPAHHGREGLNWRPGAMGPIQRRSRGPVYREVTLSFFGNLTVFFLTVFPKVIIYGKRSIVFKNMLSILIQYFNKKVYLK